MLPQSSLCISFGWRRVKITTTFIISSILRHTQTLEIESRHQAALCFVYQMMLKFQHFTAKIQRIFPVLLVLCHYLFSHGLDWETRTEKPATVTQWSFCPANQSEVDVKRSSSTIQDSQCRMFNSLPVRTDQLNWPVTGSTGLWIIPCQNNLFYYHLPDVLFWKTTAFSSSYLPTATWSIK